MASSTSSPLVGIGEVLWDVLPSGPRLGGATTNFSILCNRLGESVALVSRLGQDDLGDETLQRLHSVGAISNDSQPNAAASFDLSHVQRSPSQPTGTVTVALDAEGRPRYTIHAPVAWDELALTPDLLELAQSASVVCFGTLAQRLEPSGATIRAFLDATGPDCIRVCDVNLRAPFYSPESLRWSLGHATVLKISDEELPEVARLLGEEAGSLAAAAGGVAVAANGPEADLTACATAAAQALLSLAPHCQLVALTLGPHGSLLADRTGVHRHTGFPIQVADTIGAGDAFTAGLVHAYLRGVSLESINAVANLCGSYVASQQGATPELPPTLLARIRAALD